MGDLNRVGSREDLVSTYSRGYIEVSVSNPITHHTWDSGKFTTYQITLETNNRAFSVMKSIVRRRYSEFSWLRDVLSSHFPDIKIPTLPSKKYFGGQFNPEVIEARTVGLSEFIQQVVDEPVYLSENALHLFLQTQLSLKAIEDCIQGKSKRSVTETILKQVQRNESLTLPLDSEYISQQAGSVSSSFASSPHDIFSPTRPQSMDFPSSSESDSGGSENSGPKSDVRGRRRGRTTQDGDGLVASTSCVSGNADSRAKQNGDQPNRSSGRFLRVQSMPQIMGLSNDSPILGPSEMVVSRSFTGRSSLRTIASSSDLSDINPRRPKRHVTFSPEVTVAKIIDRFSKSPRNVKREDMPSVIIASTMAY